MIPRRLRFHLQGVVLLAAALGCSSDGGSGPGGEPVRLGLNVEPPSTALSGEPLAPAPVVELLDASGQVVARRGVAITAQLATGGGSVLGTVLVRTGADGRAVFDDLRIAGPVGTRTLRFSSAGVSAVLSRTIEVVSGPPAVVEAYAGNHQTAAAGTELPIAPAVRVLDQSGNPVEGVAVLFEITAGNGTLEGASQITGADGVARATRWTLGTSPGPNEVTVTLAGLQGSPVVFTATATVGVPSLITVVEGDDQSAVVGTPVDTAPAVKVTDAAGNVVIGIRVTFTVVSGGGSVTTASPTTNAQGIARVGAWVLGDDPGPNTLTASAGTAPPATFGATGTPVPVAVLAGNNQLGFVGDSLNGFIIVQVTGARGVPRPDVTVTFEVLSGGGFMEPTTVVTDAVGLAKTEWQLGPQEGEQTARATAPGADPALITATAVAFSQVSGAWRSTCGLSTAGEAWCWGSNFLSQLGDSSAPGTARLNPRRVVGGHTFARIASAGGGNFHCALTPADEAWCWGSDGHGQLGDGDPSGTNQRNYPVPVAGGHSWATVLPGGDHACGLTTGGEVLCWGSSTNGATGNGLVGVDVHNPSPVSGGLTFKALAVGQAHTCGLTSNDLLYCWGRRNGFTTGSGPEATPIQIGIPAGVTFVSVTAGWNHTCAIDANGGAWCWGQDARGQLGNGTDPPTQAPGAVDGGLSFASLDARGETTCGITTTGELYCWGANDAGEAGIGAIGDLISPTLVTAAIGYSMVSAGGAVTCGLQEGAPRCWGPNDSGQVGDGTRAVRTVPTRVLFP